MQLANQAAMPGAHSFPPPPQQYPPLDLSRIPGVHHDAALHYDSFVSQLTFNSKELITNLTRIAGENLPACAAISAVIDQRIRDVAPMLKLPLLYLMDSILKNIGPPYVACFAANVFHTFTTAYSVVPPYVRASMHRLLNTWPPIFGHDFVNAMRHAAHQRDAASGPPFQPPHVPPSLPMQVPHHQGPKNMPPSTYHHRSNPLQIPNHMPPQMPAPPINLTQPPPVPRLPTSGYPGYPTNIHPNRPHPSLQLGSVPPTSMPPPRAVLSGGQAPFVPPAVSSLARTDPRSMNLPHSEQRRMPLRAVPAPLPNNPPPPSEKFLHTQEMMREISRKASLGTLPSSHQLFNMNRLITGQLQSAGTPPVQRDTLLAFQQQLRDFAAAPRTSNSTAIRAHPGTSETRIPHIPFNIHTPHIPQTHRLPNVPVIPPNLPRNETIPHPNHSKSLNPELVNALDVSQAMSGLLRTIPRGVLANVARPNSLQPPHPSMLNAPPPFPHNNGVLARSVPPPMFYGTPQPTVLKYSDIKTMSHVSVVRSLYVELPNLSSGDGMRFATKEALREHLDWVYRQNRRKRSILNNESLGDHSRCWFERLDTFLGKDKNVSDGANDGNGNSEGVAGQEGKDGDGSGTSKMCSVPVKGENEKCLACEEMFETFWDVEKQNWMLADAVRTEDGEAFHPNCLQSTQKANETSEASKSDDEGNANEGKDSDDDDDDDDDDEEEDDDRNVSRQKNSGQGKETTVPTVPQKVDELKLDSGTNVGTVKGHEPEAKKQLENTTKKEESAVGTHVKVEDVRMLKNVEGSDAKSNDGHDKLKVKDAALPLMNKHATKDEDVIKNFSNASDALVAKDEPILPTIVPETMPSERTIPIEESRDLESVQVASKVGVKRRHDGSPKTETTGNNMDDAEDDNNCDNGDDGPSAKRTKTSGSLPTIKIEDSETVNKTLSSIPILRSGGVPNANGTDGMVEVKPVVREE